MRRSLLTLACASLVLLLLPAAAQAMTFNQAVDKLFRHGYPQRLERTIAGFKSTPLGFRWTGSPADNQAAQFLADEMTAAGLTNVKLEPVPVDAWTIESAKVTVGGKVMPASSYPGVPPTGPDGVTGQVVRIPNNATAADFAKAGDITGKIVVIAFDSNDWWLNFPCAEAGLRGAKAVVLVYDKRYPGYQGAPNAFASNDPGYTYSSPPLVWLPSDSATWLKRQLTNGPVTATVTLQSSHTFAEDGGVGYNVVGELPGTSADATKIVFGGHHDSHFTGALDNDTACVAQLVIAKALKMSGARPASTLVFFNTTAEEWGYTDCNYDWLVGSVYSIQHTHPDWAGKVKAMLNMELLGYKKGSLWFTATRELKPWLVAQMKAHPRLVGPKGGKVLTPDQGYWFSYNDQWPLTATGIPSTCMWTPDEYFWTHYYHTNYDARNMIDWGFFKKNIKFNAALAKSIDHKILPYSLSAQSNAVLAASTDAGFKAAGIEPLTASAYLTSMRALARASRTFDARRAAVKPAAVASTNQALLAIEKTLNSNLTALDVWDDTIYPFQQSMTDLAGMQAAVAALAKTPVAYRDAISALGNVNCAWYGIYFSYPVYYTNLLQRQPGYVHANMADLGRMAMFIDVIPELNAIRAAKSTKTVPTEAIASLNLKIAAEQADIGLRLQTLSTVLAGVATQITAITPAAK
jgi:Iap family predicted aminopeptidase